MVEFFGKERRMKKIEQTLQKYGIESLEACEKICLENGLNVKNVVLEIQPIAFDNAVWAYTLGCAIAFKSKETKAKELAKIIGIGLESFCVDGSVADERKIGLGHGELASKLLDENTKCFCFLAGHESFAAAEGAIGVINNANQVRTSPLRVILNGLGKDAAYIIARINGFTYVKTSFNYKTNKLNILEEIKFSNGERSKVKVYGAFDSYEGVAIMKHEHVDIGITGNSTNPARFQHPVAGIYKNWCNKNGLKYFSIASGGGTGRTLHPDNMACGPASYGLTDFMGKMHADAQFAGSSSVPAHVDMMGFIGMGNNPMVGATVSLAVKIEKIKS